MQLPNLPWWLNPWAEARRQRALAEHHKELEEKAARYLFEVQSYAATQLRALRIERDHARQREKLWQEKVLEIANMMPPPVQFIRKDDL